MEKITVSDVRCSKGDSAFLIDDGRTTILYDTGFGFTGFRVAENIKAILGSRKLDYIFLTHSHYDHVLGCPYILRYYPEAKVVASSYTAGVFRRAGAIETMRELDGKYAAACGEADYPFLGDELKVDVAVDDGEEFRAGDFTFKVIGFPGHTKCSVGFYCAERALLLAPESFGVYDGGDMIAPSFLSSYKSTLASIDRVLKMKIDGMVAPHLGLLSEEKTRFFLDNMRPFSEYFAKSIAERLDRGETDEEIFAWFKDKFWHGYLREIYPLDAFRLNSSIMINLIRTEGI